MSEPLFTDTEWAGLDTFFAEPADHQSCRNWIEREIAPAVVTRITKKALNDAADRLNPDGIPTREHTTSLTPYMLRALAAGPTPTEET